MLCYGNAIVDGVKYGANVLDKTQRSLHRGRHRGKMAPLTRAIKRLVKKKSGKMLLGNVCSNFLICASLILSYNDRLFEARGKGINLQINGLKMRLKI